jgi:hypothetical protein
MSRPVPPPAAPSPSVAEDELYGTYTLVSSTRQVADTGEVFPFANEKGFITYGRDGRMLCLVVRGDRPKAASIERMTDAERVQLFGSMLSYGGTYDFDGKTMKHHIDISWNEVWTGTTLIRDVRKDGNQLIYTTRPAPDPKDGRMGFSTVVWEKIR